MSWEVMTLLRLLGKGYFVAKIAGTLLGIRTERVIRI